MDNFACVGTEPTLTNCTHDTHTADCIHSEDAGVRCTGRRKLHAYNSYFLSAQYSNMHITSMQKHIDKIFSMTALFRMPMKVNFMASITDIMLEILSHYFRNWSQTKVETRNISSCSYHISGDTTYIHPITLVL